MDLVDTTSNPPKTVCAWRGKCLYSPDAEPFFLRPQPNGEINRLHVPPGTEITVSIAQFFGVALTINFMASGGDLLKGLDHLFSGYDEHIIETMEGATRAYY